MSLNARTKLGTSPFPGKAPKVKKALDLSGIVKCRDQYRPERVITQHKYDAMFAGLREGDCFRVPGGSCELSAFSRALRCYLKREGIDGIVRQQGRTDDGIGRVWLVKIIRRRGAEAVA